MTGSDGRPPFFPIGYEVEEGKIYNWCGCGKSKTQPLCDRDNCGKLSVPYVAVLTETVYFCGCKQTREPPFCDGSHGRLLREYINLKK